MRDKKVRYWEMEKFAPPPEDEEDDDEEVSPSSDFDLSTKEVRTMRLEREEDEEMFADVRGRASWGRKQIVCEEERLCLWKDKESWKLDGGVKPGNTRSGILNIAKSLKMLGHFGACSGSNLRGASNTRRFNISLGGLR